MCAVASPPDGISIRAFAALDGCSPTLVRRGIEKGRLTTLPNGNLDPALAGTGWRKSARRAADADVQADAHTARTVHTPPPDVRTPDTAAGSVKPASPPLDPDNPDDAEAIDSFIQRVLRGDFADLVEAEKAKENGLALKHLLDGRRKAGSLISFKAAQDAFFAQGRQDRDAWTAWAPRVATELAAEFGIDSRALAEALGRLVHQHLSELGEPEFEPGRDDAEG